MNEYSTNISSFDGKSNMPVVLKRPSILSLAMTGKIPNPLMSAAARLFEFAPKSDTVSLKEIGQILHIVAEASFVIPAYDEIKEKLTDQQLMEIYHYAKEGADGLEYFRIFRELHKNGGSCQGDKSGGERNVEDK